MGDTRVAARPVNSAVALVAHRLLAESHPVDPSALEGELLAMLVRHPTAGAADPEDPAGAADPAS